MNDILSQLTLQNISRPTPDLMNIQSQSKLDDAIAYRIKQRHEKSKSKIDADWRRYNYVEDKNLSLLGLDPLKPNTLNTKEWAMVLGSHGPIFFKKTPMQKVKPDNNPLSDFRSYMESLSGVSSGVGVQLQRDIGNRVNLINQVQQLYDPNNPDGFNVNLPIATRPIASPIGTAPVSGPSKTPTGPRESFPAATIPVMGPPNPLVESNTSVPFSQPELSSSIATPTVPALVSSGVSSIYKKGLEEKIYEKYISALLAEGIKPDSDNELEDLKYISESLDEFYKFVGKPVNNENILYVYNIVVPTSPEFFSIKKFTSRDFTYILDFVLRFKPLTDNDKRIINKIYDKFYIILLARFGEDQKTDIEKYINDPNDRFIDIFREIIRDKGFTFEEILDMINNDPDIGQKLIEDYEDQTYTKKQFVENAFIRKTPSSPEASPKASPAKTPEKRSVQEYVNDMLTSIEALVYDRFEAIKQQKPDKKIVRGYITSLDPVLKTYISSENIIPENLLKQIDNTDSGNISIKLFGDMEPKKQAEFIGVLLGEIQNPDDDVKTKVESVFPDFSDTQGIKADDLKYTTEDDPLYVVKLSSDGKTIQYYGYITGKLSDENKYTAKKQPYVTVLKSDTNTEQRRNTYTKDFLTKASVFRVIEKEIHDDIDAKIKENMTTVAKPIDSDVKEII